LLINLIAMKILRTDQNNKEFKKLVVELNKELEIIDGPYHTFYSQFNGIETLKQVVIVYEKDKAIGCGGFKFIQENVVEIKRMFVLPSQRKKGIAGFVLKEIEAWAKELGCLKCILETGKNLPNAVNLYTKNRYLRIPNYEPYVDIDNSLCFEKHL